MSMDENTKELAKRYMQRAAAESPCSERFPVKLAESRETSMGLLLGCYGATVEARDRDMLMDDATLSKVERVTKWMYDSRKRGLLLCGTLGNGKTTLLLAIKRLFGLHAVYMEAQSVYEHYRQNGSIPSVRRDDVLLIDDLGVEPSSYNDFGAVRYPLAELLMQRYRQNATTIVATNFTFEQIGQVYGDRLQDRMREMYALIRYVEPSYRK